MDNKIKNTLRDPFKDVFSIPDKIENEEDIQTLITGENNSTPVKSNYKKNRNNLHIKAQKTIDALFKFYLTENIINEDEYIKQKAYHEKCTLGDLMAQIEIANTAITTIMENIDMGDMSPRMFEVLSDALRTSMELLKMKSMHLINMEESMKKLMADREIYQHKAISDGSETESVTARGSKKLMQQIQDAIKNEEIEEADIN